ncbi:MAG: hypothetical protein Q9227_009128 [Pyrenula ochraceoflavens]
MDYFRSKRLIFRGIEPDDADFLETIARDSVGEANSNPTLMQPGNKKSAEKFRDHLLEKCALACIICLPPPSPTEKPISIGYIVLNKPQPMMDHHRNGGIGLSIMAAHQRKGYGREAIEWTLNWAFQMAGYHRVAIGHFSWNEGAGRLYQSIGFKVEGRHRESLWFNGGWHDLISLGMLENEWREKYQPLYKT